MQRYFTAFLIALSAFCMVYAPASAQLEIDITQGNLEPTPIAVPDFLAQDPAAAQIGKDIAEVIRADLERSGLFNALDPASFIETQTNIDYQPTFADWRVIKAEALVSGRIVRESGNRLRVEYRLWDVYRGQQLSGLRFATTPDNWRRIAHKVSDSIYEKLTGESGYFDSRIVFIDEAGPKTDRQQTVPQTAQYREPPAPLHPVRSYSPSQARRPRRS